MIEYPTIMNSSKAPKMPCIAFEKLDGSNIRVKYTNKKGFYLFGSRTQLFDETHPHLREVIKLFNDGFKEPLDKLMHDKFPYEREAIAFGEFFGKQSFAGIHVDGDPKEFILFDLFIGHKNPKFLYSQDFVKICAPIVKTSRIIYTGNLNESLIKDVRDGKYDVFEGVVCKGTERNGAFRGGIWMAKIKTKNYLDLVFKRYGADGLKLYGE